LAQVVSQDKLILQRRDWKDNGQCVVVASGTFDLLHPGHIRLLEQARSYGDVLVVAVQSDAGARKPNDPSHRSVVLDDPGEAKVPDARLRPVVPAPERAEILAALAAVDYVVVFDGPSPDAFLDRLAPDILIKGEGGDSHKVEQGRVAAAMGPKIVRIPHEPGYSTRQIIERVTHLRA
jgi:cytidyltransferase-like protein